MKIKDNMLYFAYGSNLNEKQMKKRCPAATKLCSASLGGAALGFLGGVATIFPEQGSATLGVEGGLWLITPECLKALDKYEGYPRLYDRGIVEVVDENGHARRAITYWIIKKGMKVDPIGASYLGSIVQGYKDFGIRFDGLKQTLISVGASEHSIDSWFQSWERN